MGSFERVFNMPWKLSYFSCKVRPIPFCNRFRIFIGSAIRGAHIQAAASLSGAYGVQQAVTPYGQPVIYIHPDSLSTAYPMSALGLQGLTGGYSSALETLYTPYSAANSRQGK